VQKFYDLFYGLNIFTCKKNIKNQQVVHPSFLLNKYKSLNFQRVFLTCAAQSLLFQVRVGMQTDELFSEMFNLPSFDELHAIL